MPGIANTILQLHLTRLHEGRVALLRDFHGGVTQQQRDLVDWNAGKQILNREGVPEHVRMAPLQSAIELLDRGYFEESAERSLPVRDGALRFAVAAPEKVSRVWLWA